MSGQAILPAVAVVIPLYNKAAYIGLTIQSVLAQSQGDFELIIVDDGSTDGSAAVVQAFQDSRIVLIRQANAGVSAARNRGMAAARATYIAFLDADDMWQPRHLEILLVLAAQYPGAGLWANAFVEMASDVGRSPVSEVAITYRLIDDFFAVAAGAGLPFYTSACMVPRALALALGGFPEGHSHGEDLTLWLCIACDHRIAVSSYVGCYYRRGAGGLTDHPLTEPDIAMQTLWRLQAERLDLAPAIRAVMAEYVYKLALAHALQNILHSRLAAAQGFLDIATPTRLHRRRRMILCLLLALPVPARAALISFWLRWRGHRHVLPDQS